MTTFPSVTCPSPPSATWPSRRTERMVVPWNSCMGSEPDLWTRYLEPVSKISSLHPFPPMNRRARGSGEEAHAEERHDANDQRPRGQIGDGGSEKPGRVSRRPDAIACGEASARKPARSERGNNQRGEHKVQADELHRKRDCASKDEVEAAAPHPAAQAEPHREDRRREEADDRELRRRDPQDLSDEKILEMLRTARIRGKKQDRRVGRNDERHADHRLLHVGPELFGPVEKERAGERRAQGRGLHRDALRLEAKPIGEDHPEARDLRHREVNEHDAAIQYLHAERRMRRGHEKSRDQRRPENVGIERHFTMVRRRASVSSYSLNRSFASSVPPTV